MGSITGGQELLTQVGVREAHFSMAGDPIPVAFLREKGGEGRGFAEFLSSNRRRKFHVDPLPLLELHLTFTSFENGSDMMNLKLPKARDAKTITITPQCGAEVSGEGGVKMGPTSLNAPVQKDGYVCVGELRLRGIDATSHADLVRITRVREEKLRFCIFNSSLTCPIAGHG